MSSIRNQIIAAALTALNGAGHTCTFYRSRQDEFQTAELPIGNIFPEQETSQIDAKELASILTLNVSCVIAAAEDPADIAIDPHIVWAEQALMADPTLGGLAVFMEKVSTHWFMAQKGLEQCGVTMKFDVHYRTALTDGTVDQS